MSKITVESNPRHHRSAERKKRPKSGLKNRLRKNKVQRETGPITLHYVPEIHSRPLLSPYIPKSKHKNININKDQSQSRNDSYSMIAHEMSLSRISPYIDILHCDPNLIVLCKPAGICSCKAKDDTLLDMQNLLRVYIYKHKDFTDWPQFLEVPSMLRRLSFTAEGEAITTEAEDLPFCGVIHAVERHASGVNIFGRHQKATKIMHDMFVDHRVRRTFLVCVKGCPPNNAKFGTLKHFIAETKHPIVKILSPEKLQAKLSSDDKRITAEVVGIGTAAEDITNNSRLDMDMEEAEIEMVGIGNHHRNEKWKFAESKYERLLTFEIRKQTMSLLKVSTVHQRQHQIRAQLAYEAMPILGDDKYGRNAIPFLDNTNSSGLLAIHLWYLEYECPWQQRTKRMFEAPLSQYWVKRFGSDIIRRTSDQ